MGVLLPEDRGQPWAPSVQPCFYCGEDVPGIAVYWVGDAQVILHPECAARFGAHLLGDAREAELAVGRHPWGHRAERVFMTSIVSSGTR